MSLNNTPNLDHAPMPQADPAFQRDLEDRLLQMLQAQSGDAPMIHVNGYGGYVAPTPSPKRAYVSFTLAAALLMVLAAASLLLIRTGKNVTPGHEIAIGPTATPTAANAEVYTATPVQPSPTLVPLVQSPFTATPIPAENMDSTPTLIQPAPTLVPALGEVIPPVTAPPPDGMPTPTMVPSVMPANLRPVVIALRDLRPGTVLQPTDLAVVYWPEAIVPPNAVASIEQLVSRIPVKAVAKWQPLLADQALTIAVPNDKVAVSIPIKQITTVVDAIRAGDRVEVIADVKLTQDIGLFRGTIASDVLVVYIGRVTSGDVDLSEAIITLAVSPQQASLLTQVVDAQQTFTLVKPSNIRFGSDLTLHSYSISKGDLYITLNWEANQAATLGDYAAFLHVFDQDGKLISQRNWAITMPAPGTGKAGVSNHIAPIFDPPPGKGMYRVYVGVYGKNGERLPARSVDGTALPDNQALVYTFSVGQ